MVAIDGQGAVRQVCNRAIRFSEGCRYSFITGDADASKGGEAGVGPSARIRCDKRAVEVSCGASSLEHLVGAQQQRPRDANVKSRGRL